MANYKYDAYGRTEAANIYIARPGKRILGVLNGINRDSCNLDIDFIDTDTLTFDVYKYHDGEPTPYYDYVDILMELYVDGHGWFFIDTPPTTRHDGTVEYKTVTAQSYEITLHQYDLVDFDINTASSTSREMLATDNVYTYSVSGKVWYNLFRDNVLFYRDTTQHKALVEAMNEETTFEEFQELLATYPRVAYSDWRIKVAIDANLRSAFVTMKNNAESEGERNLWQLKIDTYDNMMASGGQQITSDEVKNLITSYPELVKYVTLDIDKFKYKFDDYYLKYEKTDEEYTAYELAQMEYKRMKELSLLDLAISEVPGWEIGYVDNQTYYTHTDINGVPVQLANEVGNFEIDSQDVYSFLVNELEGYFSCIFQFDTMNNLINVYRVDTIGKDTQIFVGFRNVENSVEITPAQDLYTQFTVENSEGLGITGVNFGVREIEDISYFLTTKYLPQELIDKYKRYLEYRENVRPTYIDLSKQIDAQWDVCREIKDRVPSDMLNLSQLDNYTSMDQIKEEIANYYALLVGILDMFIYVKTDVETPGAEETYQDYNDYLAAWDAYITALESYVDVGKEESQIAFADSLYKKSYDLAKNFTIPNLKITLSNLQLPSYETKQDYYDAFEYDFQTYGDMYGLTELETYKKKHTDSVEAYSEYATPWEDIPDTEAGNAFKATHTEEEYNSKHELYVKYYNGLQSVLQEIEERQAEYDAAVEEWNRLNDQRDALAKSVTLEHYSESVSMKFYREIVDGYFYQEDHYYLGTVTPDAAFTKEEIDLLTRFYRHTDYQNDNIQHLDLLDNASSTIDKQQEMYNEAVDELYSQAHPQYTYNTTLDNLLANNEYEDFHPDFKVGNFIRLGLDDETQVQLRMITISYNPVIYDNNLTINFSNMTNYKSRRNDFASLLNSTIKSAKNSITARYRKEADSNNTVQVTYDLVQQILQSSAFGNYTQNVQANSVNAATGSFQALTTGFLKTDELAAEVGNITELHSDSVFANYIKSQLIASSTISADQIVDGQGKTVVDLVNDNIDIGTITTNIITGQDSSGNYYIDLIAGEIAIDRLVSSDGKTAIEFINGAVSTDAITANIISGRDSQGRYYIDLLAGEIAIDRLTSSDGKTAVEFVNGAVSTEQIATDLITGRDGQDRYYIDLISGALNMNTIASNSAFINSLTSQQAFIDYLESNLIVAKAVEADSVKAENIDFTTASGAQAFIDFIQAHSITTETLAANLANISTLTAGSAFVSYLQSLSSTTATSVINDAYIYNAVANKITVADLAAGDIVLSDQMRILSENTGTEGMVMSGSEIQFLDGDGNPSISIGYNTVSDGQGGTTVDYNHPAIIIKDENGSVMLNSSGLSQGDVGLAPMIQTSSISKSQLNFPIVEANEYGGVDITQIYDGSGGNFGVEYTTFKQGTQDALDEIESKKMYRVVVESDNGNIFKNGDVNCTLSCRVYSWDDEITNDINAANFTWTRKSKNTTDDAQWNANHSGGTKTITITPSDVYGRSVFYCTVTLPDGTVQSSG